MTPLDQAQMLLRKAAQDEARLDSILEDKAVSAEIFGYHCQQALEKLLKASLAQRAVHYPKTYNLQALVELLEARGRPLPTDLADLDQFTPYATVYRYEQVPEYMPLDRKAARAFVARVRAFAEQQMKHGTS
jgi:HEPN domain-containing protein